jgi:hypothetical protein
MLHLFIYPLTGSRAFFGRGVCAAVKKYFTTPLRPPLAGLSWYMEGQVYLYRQSYTGIRQMHLPLIIGNMRKKAACG